MRCLYSLWWISVLAVAVSGCAVNPVTGKSDFVLLSESQEISLGTRYHQKINTQYGVYKDPQLQALIAKVGNRLARVSHRPQLRYRSTLLDSPEVNAFALPGGYVYITRGLLAYLNSEAELAAVLGHEIGHVTARHSVRQHSASTVTGLFGAILGAQVGAGGQELVSLAGTALVRGYGREHELESDRLGAEYLARAGYDPNAMLRVIGVLKNQEQYEIAQAKAEGREPRVYHGLFSTHPDNDRRLQEVVGAAKGQATAPAPRGQDIAFLRKLDGLVFGDSEQQGIIRDSHFYHGPLGIRLVLPEGWRTVNSPQHLAMIAPNRDALIVMAPIPHQSGEKLSDLLKSRFQNVEPRNVFTIKESGREGYGATLRLSTPFGMRDSRVVLMRIGGEVFQLIAAANPKPWPAAYARVMGATLRGLHPLKKSERSLARAARIKLIKVGAGETVAVLSRSAQKPEVTSGQLRLLNDLYPQGEPKLNQWIKVIK